MRFYARDLHLVVGTGNGGQPVRFRVLLDGAARRKPRHGHRCQGVVREQRLYQIIPQTAGVREHLFSIEFLDDGVEAYSFTFG